MIKNTRLVVVDALRGFALFGLFMVHMVEYFELYWHNPEPHIVNDVVFFLFGGKAYAIFALLFGLSFSIVIENQKNKGIDFRTRFCWRLLLLALLGYLHSLLYSGDILQVLAIAGFYLVLVSRLSNTWLFVLSILFVLQAPMMMQIYYYSAFPNDVIQQPMHWNLMGSARQTIIEGGFYEMLTTNSWQNQLGKWVFFYESGRIWTILGLFTTGLLLGRIKFFEKLTEYQNIITKVFIGAISLLLVSKLLAYLIPSFSFTGIVLWQMQQLISSYQSLSLMILGIITFIYCYRIEFFTRLFSVLIPCGRMSLTVYISQSLICIPIFYPFGLGLYENIGQPLSLLLGFVLWLAVIAFSHLWMKHFYFGPFEWLWRKATYLGLSQETKFRRTII